MFDIVFMDCNMPFMDGPTATKEIRSYIASNMAIASRADQLGSTKNWRQPMIFAVTGHTEETFTSHALQMGMDQVISKPATTDKIQMALCNAEERFNPNSELFNRKTVVSATDIVDIFTAPLLRPKP
mmetsp:Transcript_41679/g.63687  ORF Transcript_41679/g.63687 Transcript_41679/m.63687 type:complete len:127 (+) Transcript_41679:2741-3121(+)